MKAANRELNMLLWDNYSGRRGKEGRGKVTWRCTGPLIQKTSLSHSHQQVRIENSHTHKPTHCTQITPAPLTEKKRADVRVCVYACTHAHTDAAVTTKWGMLIGQMGSFFCAHALASISISTEDHSCESSLPCALLTHRHAHTHTPQKFSLPYWQTNMRGCGSAFSPPATDRRVNWVSEWGVNL